MERVKSAKKQPQVTHVAVVPKEQVDSQDNRILPRVRPTKALPDPHPRTRYALDGYSAPELAFRIGLRTKSGVAGDSVPVHVRVRGQVRVYYAGQILLGSVTVGELFISAHFHHNLTDEEYQRFDTIEQVHVALRKMLQADVSQKATASSVV